MSREIQINHSEIKNPQEITKVVARKFKEQGLNHHVHEVIKLADDFSKGVRHLKIRNTKYFFQGRT